MAAHQAPPSLGFSRQEHWSGLPFPSPMHESESEVAQSCPTLCNPKDCSLPGSSIHGIFQARVLECVAIAFSNLVIKQQQTPETERFAQCLPQFKIAGLPQRGRWLCRQRGTYAFWHQFSSVSQSCLTLCDPTDCSLPGFPVHHQLLELTQTRVHWICDAIQPSHPLSFSSPPTFNLSPHQPLFQWVSSLHQLVKVLEFQLQHHQSFHWIFRTDCAARLDGKEKHPREAELSRSASSQSQEAQSPTSSHEKLWPLNKRSLERILGAYEIGKRKKYFIVIDLSPTY